MGVLPAARVKTSRGEEDLTRHLNLNIHAGGLSKGGLRAVWLLPVPAMGANKGGFTLMKFGIKHALVVAICALCVCVVATGTVVAVTSATNRNAEASQPGGVTTIRFFSGTIAAPVPSTASARFWSATGLMSNVASITVGSSDEVWLTAGGRGFTHVRNPQGVAPAVWSPTPNNLAMTGRPVEPPATQGAGVSLTWGSTGNSAITVRGIYHSSNTTLDLFIGDRIVLAPSGADAEVQFEIIRTVRSAASGTGTTTVTSTFERGFRDIPLPANQQATFRGWALEPGGTLLFPRGLPVAVFANKRLYAIHS